MIVMIILYNKASCSLWFAKMHPPGLEPGSPAWKAGVLNHYTMDAVVNKLDGCLIVCNMSHH